MQYATPRRKTNLLVSATLVAVSFLTACSSVPASSDSHLLAAAHDVSYQIDVSPSGQARVNNDGFDAEFVFQVYSLEELRQNCLVQELSQTARYEYADGRQRVHQFSLVEAFRLHPQRDERTGMKRYALNFGQSDHHFYTGLNELPEDVIGVTIERRVVAYVATVTDADFTYSGFAQLPRNEVGDVITTASKQFNAAYQRKHETRGEVRDTNRAGGIIYRLRYHLSRTGKAPAEFTVDRGGGFGRVVPMHVKVER